MVRLLWVLSCNDQSRQTIRLRLWKRSVIQASTNGQEKHMCRCYLSWKGCTGYWLLCRTVYQSPAKGADVSIKQELSGITLRLRDLLTDGHNGMVKKFRTYWKKSKHMMVKRSRDCLIWHDTWNRGRIQNQNNRWGWPTLRRISVLRYEAWRIYGPVLVRRPRYLACAFGANTNHLKET